jgi:hypothetical protein
LNPTRSFFPTLTSGALIFPVGPRRSATFVAAAFASTTFFPLAIRTVSTSFSRPRTSASVSGWLFDGRVSRTGTLAPSSTSRVRPQLIQPARW